MSGRGKPGGRKRKAQTKLPENQETRCKKTPPPGGHVFLPIQTILELNCRIQETDAKNVSSRLFTCFHNIHIEKTAPPPIGNVFPPIMTIFELAKNVSSRLFTCFHNIHIEKTAPPPVGNVFPPIMTIFELVRDIYKNRYSGIYASIRERVNKLFLLYKYMENAPPPGGYVFYRSESFLNSTVISEKHHVLTKFHEDWTKHLTSRVFTCFHYIHIEKTAPSPGGLFLPICTIFELVQDINETNVLTKFHNDWAKIVTSRVFTRNTAPPPFGHVFQWTGTIFELNQHII
ncbi:hypothetical protein DPMN_117646 [Dreissena polymorpha]|uniref:Uncharacterized protein n=1 Tax=Dreissena polymorpha TaxID=45954 RepID=A0A9D4GLK0_DREPO|nr:hypothetical protein DPMN_117646 [Dreissena polymorpha]